MFINW